MARDSRLTQVLGIGLLAIPVVWGFFRNREPDIPPVPAPVAGFTYAPDATNPLLIRFTNITAGDVDWYSWDFGDPGSGSNSSNDASPSHIYASPGDYTVILTASGPGGLDIETQTIAVISDPDPDPTAQGSITFGRLSTNGGEYEDIDPNGAVMARTGDSLVFAYAWRNDGIDPFNGFMDIVVIQPNGSNVSIAAGLNNGVIGAPGDSRFVEFDPYISGQEGEHRVIPALRSHPQGVQIDSAQTRLTLEATAGPIAAFDYTVEDKTVTFINQSSTDVFNWFWEFGDGDTDILSNPVHTYDNYGVYFVTLRVASAGGTDTTSPVRISLEETLPGQIEIVSGNIEGPFNVSEGGITAWMVTTAPDIRNLGNDAANLVVQLEAESVIQGSIWEFDSEGPIRVDPGETEQFRILSVTISDLSPAGRYTTHLRVYDNATATILAEMQGPDILI